MPRARGPSGIRSFAFIVLAVGAVIAGCSVFRPLIRPFIKPFSVDRIDPGFEMPRECVMLFYVDGLRKDVLEEMAAAGEMPLLKKYILDRGASVDNAITGLPSITYANATSMVTGLFPGHHDIIANKWFDRDRLLFRNYESRHTMIKVNTDLTVPTIYEMLDDKLTADVGMQLSKGAKLHFVTESGDGGLPAGVAWSLGYQDEVDAIMAENIADLGKEARCLHRWPELTLVYFPGPDDVAHYKSWNSPEYRAALRALDCSLGSILRALDEGGVMDNLTLILTADHGHHAVGKRNYLDLPTFFRQCIGIHAYGCEHDIDEDFSYLDVSHQASWRSRERKFRNWPAVIAHNGERQASIHLRAGNDWSARPTIEQILWFQRGCEGSVSTATGALSLPETLVGHPAIAFAAAREAPDSVQVFGKAGIARVERNREGDGPSYRYQVLSGADPLFQEDGAAPALADGKFHPSRAWLEATAELSHPDVVSQIVEVFDSRRAGDLMVFAAPGWDFSAKYAGGHGGLERDEMRIPLYFAGPRIPPGTRIHAARLVDVVPTMLDVLGLGDRAKRLCKLDGVTLLRSLVPESQPAAPEKQAPSPEKVVPPQ